MHTDSSDFKFGDLVVVVDDTNAAGFYHKGETGVVDRDNEKQEAIDQWDKIYPGFAKDTVLVRFGLDRIVFVGVQDIEFLEAE